MTKPTRQGGPSADRWLISYADFITLMFGFFVVLYAVAQLDHAKPRDVSESVQRAFAGHTAATTQKPTAAARLIAKVDSNIKKPEAHSDLARSYADLKDQLQQEIRDGKMDVTMDARGIIIGLHEKSFFHSGRDVIYPSAFGSMAKVAAIIRGLPNPVLLEGHTDSVPIHNQRFRSNWDLSAARSISVLQFFEAQYDIPAQRFAIAGYADNLPVAGNDSDEGRSKNRRVDIVIVGR